MAHILTAVQGTYVVCPKRSIDRSIDRKQTRTQQQQQQQEQQRQTVPSGVVFFSRVSFIWTDTGQDDVVVCCLPACLLLLLLLYCFCFWYFFFVVSFRFVSLLLPSPPLSII